MGSLTDSNACYGGNFEDIDFIGGGLGGTYLTPGQCGGGKKRKQMRTKKKRGSSKRKNRRVSTLRKKRGSSKRKNRGSFKRRKHSKREVVQSIMKGLGEKRKSRKKSIKGGGGKAKLDSVYRMMTDDPKSDRLRIIMTVTSYGDEDPFVEAGFDYAKSDDGFSMCQVTSVVRGGPAQRAGVQKGDYLLFLNDVDVTRMDFLTLYRTVLKEANTLRRTTFGVDNVYTFGPPNCLGGHRDCDDCKVVAAPTPAPNSSASDRCPRTRSCRRWCTLAAAARTK